MSLGSLRLATSRFTLGLSDSKSFLFFLSKRSECLIDFFGCIKIARWRLLLPLCDHEVIICTSTSTRMRKGSLCADRLPLRHRRLWRVALSRYWCVWVNIFLSTPTSTKATRLPAHISWFNLLSKTSATFARWLILS